MGIDATLTRYQADRLFLIVREMQFDPSEFEWSEVAYTDWIGGLSQEFLANKLEFARFPYWFIFGDRSVSACPGTNHKIEHYSPAVAWETKEANFKQWLARLRKEIESPDFWRTVGQERALSIAASSSRLDNKPFSNPEIRLIHSKLDELKISMLESQHFDAQQADFIEGQFSYLKESAARLGRKDWLNALLGGLVGLAITLLLDPEKARGLLALAGTAFQSLWESAQAYLH